MVPALGEGRTDADEPLINNGVPATFGGLSHGPHQRPVLVRRRRLAVGRRHQHRARRGQDARREQPRDRVAQAGQRVVLIDADMRRPRVHNVFDLKQEPGLSNLLVGNAKVSDGLRKTRVGSLGAAGRDGSRRTRRSSSARSGSRTSWPPVDDTSTG